MNLIKVITRVLAFVGKEIVEVARRPGALISLILGPFLIMAIFGAGYSGYRRPLNTVVVVPEGSGLPTDVADHRDVVLGVDEHLEARSNEGLIVGDDHSDGHGVVTWVVSSWIEVSCSKGKYAATRKPPPGRGPASRWPPKALFSSVIVM